MQQDLRVRDLGQCRLAVRSDLVWTPQSAGGHSYYLIEDLLNSRFYRVGTSEYAFISLLDGRTSITEALGLTAKANPNAALSEHEAATICNWLLENGLVQTSGSSSPDAPSSSATEKGQTHAWSRWNPLGFRVPLLYPDRFFEAALPWLGWVFTPRAFTVWIVLGIIAIYHLSSHWSRVLASFEGIFSPMNWLWLPLIWLALKLVHEFAHGLACKKHGGSVREAGVILILLLPVSYVDVTSSWRFRSKWHRMLTAAAGMYAEFFIASVAVLFWSFTGPGLFNSLCFNVVIMASLTTLVFNGNCLMKFDGYYVLSDWLEIPNLYTLAQKLVSSYAFGPFFRAGTPLPSLPKARSKRVFIFCYGVASFLWRILVCASMIIAASTLFNGAGIILALIAVVLWLGVPTARFVARVLQRSSAPNGTKSMSYPAMGLATILALLLVTTVPSPGTPKAPAVVEYSPLVVVRADSPGFVSDIRVRGGSQVKKGDVLAVLRNDDLEYELADLRFSLEQSRIKSRVHEHKREMAAWQAEAKNFASLQKKYDEKQLQVESLTVRAPASGTVLAHNLSALKGVFLQPGDEFLSLGSETRKELHVALSEDDLSPFKMAVGQPLYVRLPGDHVFQSRLLRIAPRASLECPHSALSAANGGPLAVEAKVADVEDPLDPQQEHSLLVPHFVGTIELTNEQSLQLKTGQVGVAAVRSHREAIGKHFYRAITRWVRQKLRSSAHAQSA